MIKISDLFEVVYGCNLELSRLDESEDGIPFVSRTSKNNGISAYVKPIDIKPNPAHTLSVAGGGSVLETFYQANEFYSGRDLFYLKPKVEMSPETMIYYAVCIKANKFKYSYGRQANKTLGELKIPSLKDLPSWISNKKICKVEILESNNEDLKTANWKSYIIENLFDVFRSKNGVYLSDIEDDNGIYPIVSSSKENNGISTYTNVIPTVTNVPCLTIAHDGSVGEVFYQSEPFHAAPTITILSPKNKEKFTVNFALFIATLLRYEGKTKYNYARKWSLDKVKYTKIKLPSDGNNIDYDFIERYMNGLKSKYKFD